MRVCGYGEEMAESYFVDVDIEWRKSEPDGSYCEGCGEKCFLNMLRMYLGIEGDWTSTFVVLCESCHNAIKD